MPFSFPSRRTSTQSDASSHSSRSSIDETLLATTLPIAPREDNYAISEHIRQQRLLAKCKRLDTDQPHYYKSVKQHQQHQQQQQQQSTTPRRN